MALALREYSQEELPLLARFKGRGDDHVAAGIECEPVKHASPVGKHARGCLLVDSVATILPVLLNLQFTASLLIVY